MWHYFSVLHKSVGDKNSFGDKYCVTALQVIMPEIEIARQQAPFWYLCGLDPLPLNSLCSLYSLPMECLSTHLNPAHPSRSSSNLHSGKPSLTPQEQSSCYSLLSVITALIALDWYHPYTCLLFLHQSSMGSEITLCSPLVYKFIQLP